ncbi:hypothetical protein ACFFU1_18045 [Algibacter miyuki]|uniref:Uncharacterized protein n=1 Tax=Algibacter miyuki TaxID=1306933 RepID=A0ABV5H4I3_9FLAO|nr:hypothetical protein [Algibacter miyuki]MDN3664002.1 hypothetical protein [Algibacter miyuki]
MKEYNDEFYGADEFKKIYPNKEKWKYNYTKNITELFAETPIN